MRNGFKEKLQQSDDLIIESSCEEVDSVLVSNGNPLQCSLNEQLGTSIIFSHFLNSQFETMRDYSLMHWVLAAAIEGNKSYILTVLIDR